MFQSTYQKMVKEPGFNHQKSSNLWLYQWISTIKHGTFWLCQNSYWKWPFIKFIASCPINMVIFHSYVNVYQRVNNIWDLTLMVNTWVSSQHQLWKISMYLAKMMKLIWTMGMYGDVWYDIMEQLKRPKVEVIFQWYSGWIVVLRATRTYPAKRCRLVLHIRVHDLTKLLNIPDHPWKVYVHNFTQPFF